MDKRTKEFIAATGLVFGLGLATGPAVLAQRVYEAADTAATQADQNTLHTIGDIAYGIDLGGIALALASGFALRELENQPGTESTTSRA